MSEMVKEIELKKIRPNRLNPRLDINIEHLNELADSIKEVGLLEPIIVRPVNNEFEVVVGERRYRASQQAGLEKVSAIVRKYSDDEVVQLNLIENVQREDLSAIEKGKVCKYLLEKYPEKYPHKWHWQTRSESAMTPYLFGYERLKSFLKKFKSTLRLLQFQEKSQRAKSTILLQSKWGARSRNQRDEWK